MNFSALSFGGGDFRLSRMFNTVCNNSTAPFFKKAFKYGVFGELACGSIF